MKKITIIVLAIMLLFSSQLTVSAADISADAVSKAVDYLHRVQNDDGGFPYSKGEPSSQIVTCWVLSALKSVNQEAGSDDWAPAGLSPLDYIAGSPMLLSSTCDYARTLLAFPAAGETAYKNELIQSIISFQQEDGQFARISEGEKGFINSHMWAIIALDSAKQEVPNRQKAKEWLISRQNSDGGFGWCEGSPSDADDTAAAVQALVILSEDTESPESIKSALKYLKSCQGTDGGFSSGYLAGEKSNASSDAWVIQALLSCGEDPGEEAWSAGKANAINHLVGLQDESGFFHWKDDLESAPVLTTATALKALGMLQSSRDLNGIIDEDSAGKYTFSDLPEKHWAYRVIADLAQAGVLAGYPDGTVKPDQAVTRAEFSRMLVIGLNLQAEGKSGNEFIDIAPGFWAESYINICAEKGYIQGRPGNIFDPNSNINGAEIAVILYKSLNSEAAEIKPGDIWYETYVQTGIEKGWLYPGFQAEAAANRAESAYSIMKIRDNLGIR